MVGQPYTNRSPVTSRTSLGLALTSSAVLVSVLTMTSSPVQAGTGPESCVENTAYVSTVDGGYTYVAFKNSASCVYTIAGTSVEYVVVGGGGGGGRRHAGGGGAGGMLAGSADVLACSTLTVTVGAGGTGKDVAVPASGTSGGDSILDIGSTGTEATMVKAFGGAPGSTASDSASNGGSGGGGVNTSGNGTLGQGNNGSIGRTNVFGGDSGYWGGGGGGAGSAGTQGTTTGGDGGSGSSWLPGVFTAAVASSLGLDASLVSGGNVYFAGGGGGGAVSGSNVATRVEGGLGGLGGGARGGAGGGLTLPLVDVAGADGVSGSGGGGGGGGLIDNGGTPAGYSLGGDGGSGIVILRFVAGDPCTTPGGGSSRFDYVLPTSADLPDTR